MSRPENAKAVAALTCSSLCSPEDVEFVTQMCGVDKLVYLAQISTGPIKVGIANDPFRRLADIQAVCPYDVTPLRITWGGAALERYLHHRWRKHCVRGEWFEPVEEILRYAAGDAELSVKMRRGAKVRIPGTNWRGRETPADPSLSFRDRLRAA